jgi:hypothetical protein
VIDQLFECVLLADQSLVRAVWVAPTEMVDVPQVVEILKQGHTGRAPLGEYELQWRAEPGSAITTVRKGGHVVLMSVAVIDSAAELLQVWLTALRGAKPIAQLHGDDPQAFDVIRHLRQRPMLASVLLPEGSREESKALLDLHRSVAFALLSANWS